MADWFNAAYLRESCDLAPTSDLRAALRGILRDHLRIGETVLAKNAFPGGATGKAMQGLMD